jgi:predicted AAA+ superfamily ATPase
METTNKYLDILEGTFIFTRVKPYFTNVRKELSKMPKIFIEDLAIKNYEL